jgi:hypothetical protein
VSGRLLPSTPDNRKIKFPKIHVERYSFSEILDKAENEQWYCNTQSSETFVLNSNTLLVGMYILIP